MVIPIRPCGTDSDNYVELNNYGHFYDRANAAQVHCYSFSRARSVTMEQLQAQNFNQKKSEGEGDYRLLIYRHSQGEVFLS